MTLAKEVSISVRRCTRVFSGMKRLVFIVIPNWVNLHLVGS